jgi:hypothetical protein
LKRENRNIKIEKIKAEKQKAKDESRNAKIGIQKIEKIKTEK